MTNTVKAIIIPEGTSDLVVKQFENEITYEDIRNTVDGLIERTFISINGVDYVFYTNEEFLYLGMKPSLVFTSEDGNLEGLLAGNIFIVKDNFNTSEFTPLEEQDVMNITEYFINSPKVSLSLKDDPKTTFVVNTYPAKELNV